MGKPEITIEIRDGEIWHHGQLRNYADLTPAELAQLEQLTNEMYPELTKRRRSVGAFVADVNTFPVSTDTSYELDTDNLPPAVIDAGGERLQALINSNMRYGLAAESLGIKENTLRQWFVRFKRRVMS